MLVLQYTLSLFFICEGDRVDTDSLSLQTGTNDSIIDTDIFVSTPGSELACKSTLEVATVGEYGGLLSTLEFVFALFYDCASYFHLTHHWGWRSFRCRYHFKLNFVSVKINCCVGISCS